jgi:hypothetical protein
LIRLGFWQSLSAGPAYVFPGGSNLPVDLDSTGIAQASPTGKGATRLGYCMALNEFKAKLACTAEQLHMGRTNRPSLLVISINEVINLNHLCEA